MRTPSTGNEPAMAVRTIGGAIRFAFPLVFFGCASTAPLEQEMARMRDELRRVHTQLSVTQERLDKVEASITLLSSSRGRPSEAAPVSTARKRDSSSFGGVPKLPVVRLAAPQSGSEESTDDGSAPIEIRLGPDEVPSTDRLPVDHEVLSRPDPVLGNLPAPAVKPKETSAKSAETPKKSLEAPSPAPKAEETDASLAPKKEYEQALATLRERAMPAEARAAFRAFLQHHPESSLVDNALYWLGECSIVEGKYESAIEELSKVLSEHPDSPKVPYALLRIGESWIKLGDTEQATTFLERVTADHAGSEAAIEASKALKNLKSGENS